MPKEFVSNQLYKADAYIVAPEKEKWKERFLEKDVTYELVNYDAVTRESGDMIMVGYIKDGDRTVAISEQQASVYMDRVEYIDNCLRWYEPKYPEYNLEQFSTEQDLAFMSRDEMWVKVKTELEALGISMQHACLESVFAMPYQTLQEQEWLAVEREELLQEDMKDAWSIEDDAYYVYVWQYFQGLPVFPKAYVDDFYGNDLEGGITACYDKDGFLALRMDYWMEFEKDEELLELCPLENIMDTICSKYGEVVSESKMTLTSCRLFEAPVLKCENQYEVIPVWICQIETEDMTNDIYLPINAVTGEEIEEMKLE